MNIFSNKQQIMIDLDEIYQNTQKSFGSMSFFFSSLKLVSQSNLC